MPSEWSTKNALQRRARRRCRALLQVTRSAAFSRPSASDPPNRPAHQAVDPVGRQRDQHLPEAGAGGGGGGGRRAGPARTHAQAAARDGPTSPAQVDRRAAGAIPARVRGARAAQVEPLVWVRATATAGHERWGAGDRNIGHFFAAGPFVWPGGGRRVGVWPARPALTAQGRPRGGRCPTRPPPRTPPPAGRPRSARAGRTRDANRFGALHVPLDGFRTRKLWSSGPGPGSTAAETTTRPPCATARSSTSKSSPKSGLAGPGHASSSGLQAPAARAEKRTPFRRSAYTGPPAGVTATSSVPGRDSRGASGSAFHALESAGRNRTAVDRGARAGDGVRRHDRQRRVPATVQDRSSGTGDGTAPAATSVTGGAQRAPRGRRTRPPRRGPRSRPRPTRPPRGRRARTPAPRARIAAVRPAAARAAHFPGPTLTTATAFASLPTTRTMLEPAMAADSA